MVDNLETIAWTFESGLKSMQRQETMKMMKKLGSRHDADTLRVSFEL